MRRVLALMTAAVCAFAAPSLAEPTTYQGRLNDGLASFSGQADFAFTIFDQPIGGDVLVARQEIAGVSVANGLFTATFDAGALSTTNAWLHIEVRTPGAAFVPLTPRQRLTAAPVAASLVGLASAQSGEVLAVNQPLADVVGGITGLQSFTAESDGLLRSIDLFIIRVFGSDDQGSIRIRLLSSQGEPLADLTQPFDGRNNGFRRVDFTASDIRLVSGQVYQIEFTLISNRAVAVGMGSNNPYPGGGFIVPGSPIQTNADLAFQVRVLRDAFSTQRWIGIGVANPQAPLHVQGSAFLGDTTLFGGLTTNGLTFMNGTAQVTARLGIGQNVASPLATVHASGNGNVLRLEGTNHTFMEFFSSGPNTRSAYIGTPAPGSTDFNIVNERTGATINLTSATVRVNGNFVNASDARDKHDVRDIDDPLALVGRLHGLRYRWNDHAHDGQPLPQGEQLGFMAQDVELVLPELVATLEDGRKAVSYVGVVPLLVEALKQQQAQIARRDAEIADLRARFDRLETALNHALARESAAHPVKE